MDTELQFRQEIRALLGGEQQPRLLLAVSGGLDSVVLAQLCRALQQAEGRLFCAVAHMNYGLRPESDEDARFVKKLTTDLGFRLHLQAIKVDSKAGGLQAAARSARYAWLESLRQANNYTHIATAHHLDDSLETLLLHLVRGTGAAALRGVAPQRGPLIRPLHTCTKAQLLALARARKWTWHEDKSNHTDNYLRNRLRHEVAAPLSAYFATDYAPLRRTLTRLRETQAVFDEAAAHFSSTYLNQVDTGHRLGLPPSWQSPATRGLLFAVLQRFGLSYSSFEQLCHALASATATGKHIRTPTHSIHIDRGYLHILPARRWTELSPIEVPEGCRVAYFGTYELCFQKMSQLPKSLSQTPPDQAYLDEDRLHYPLELRSPRLSDRFYPLGMSGQKKLSDFMIDQKIARPAKKKLFLLTSEKKIAWFVGLRIDERFRLRPETKNVLHVRVCSPIF